MQSPHKDHLGVVTDLGLLSEETLINSLFYEILGDKLSISNWLNRDNLSTENMKELYNP